MELDSSILLQKQVRDNSEDLQSEFLDLKNWEAQMKRKEQEILNDRNEQEIIPPIRSKNKKTSTEKETKTPTNSKRIKSYDYSSWNKFDVDKACKELESEDQSDESIEEPLSEEELRKNQRKALEYKRQGNDFVKEKKWDKAIASYSKAIQIFPYDAIFYANRALCYLKQDNLYSAEADCSSAIQLDETYVKAYHRRATARLGLKQYKEAMEDVNKIANLEPNSKETKTLLAEVEKHIENSLLSKELCTTDVPKHEKIINKSDHKKTEQKIIEIKEDKNKKSNTNVENIVKPTTTSITNAMELQKNQCIPDWLPEKDDVEIIEPIEKPPHLRSKEPLKKIPVVKADLSKPFKEQIKATCSKNQYRELSDVHSDNTIKQKENVTINKAEKNFIESSRKMPPVPINAVQFITNWRKDTSSDFRYRYLKQIPYGDLPKIFKDSMESDIFSDILMILKTEFMRKRNEPVLSYLIDLSNVKRFRTFIMFLNKSEKYDLKLMLAYSNTAGEIPLEMYVHLPHLWYKYELR
ncbi:hypothetical protein PUN28_003004 [Cardiocondyla obscurior]|uniref:RNA polymerase II-associated protein 3 n=1 Tax=Cardiocondyla obscurior TaxID=286306 RepID=A0AAW2GXH3_9HYME